MEIHFFDLTFCADRLRCTKQTIRNTFKGNLHGRLTNLALITLLNLSRRAGQPPLDFIPDDLLTPDEVAAEILPPRADARRGVLALVNRKRNPLPHYRLNKHTVRVRRSSLQSWMAAIRRKEHITVL